MSKEFTISAEDVQRASTNWRDYEIEVTDIDDANLAHLSTTPVFQSTFRNFNNVPISDEPTESADQWNYVQIVLGIVVIVVTILAFRQRDGIGYIFSRASLRRLSNRFSFNKRKGSSLNLVDTIEQLNELTKKGFILDLNNDETLDQVVKVSSSLFSNLVDNYELLETSSANEQVMGQIDTLLHKISKKTISDYQNLHKKPSLEEKKRQIKLQEIVDKIKHDLTEIRSGLSKIVFISDSKHKQENYQKLRQAMELNIVNCIMDYTSLLNEYSDTNHSLYCDAVSQIDAYYSGEEQRIQSNADSDLKRYMEDISSTFQMMSVVGHHTITEFQEIGSSKIGKRTICETTEATTISRLVSANGNSDHMGDIQIDHDHVGGADPSGVPSGGVADCWSPVVEQFCFETNTSRVTQEIRSKVFRPSSFASKEYGDHRDNLAQYNSNSGSSSSSHGEQMAPRPPLPPTRPPVMRGGSQTTPLSQLLSPLPNENYSQSPSPSMYGTGTPVRTMTTISETHIAAPFQESGSSSSVMTSPQVSSMWALEVLKVKRESNLAMNNKIEALYKSRADNEHRARVWARKVVEGRRMEISNAKLFLETLKEHRMTRFAHSSSNTDALVRDYHEQLQDEKTQQQKLDRRVFLLTSLAVCVIYVAVYSRYDPTRGADTTWGTWLVENARRTCSLIECQEAARTATTNIKTNTAVGGGNGVPPHTTTGSVHPPGTRFGSSGGSVRLSDSGTVTYGGVTSSLLSLSPLNYIISWLIPVAMMPADFMANMISSSSVGAGLGASTLVSGGALDWREISEYLRCATYFIIRVFPPVLAAKLVTYTGSPRVLVSLVALYSFSDLLWRILIGPLQPLLWLTVLQFALYQTLLHLDSHSVTWDMKLLLRTRNVRWIALYILYPVLLCTIASVLSCMLNVTGGSGGNGGGGEVGLAEKCTLCIKHTIDTLLRRN